MPILEIPIYKPVKEKGGFYRHRTGEVCKFNDECMKKLIALPAEDYKRIMMNQYDLWSRGCY